MSNAAFVFNGIDGSSGEYVTPELTDAEVAQLAAAGSTPPDHLRDLALKKAREQEATFAPVAWVDPTDLGSAGWGVIFPHAFDPAVRDALGPLLKHRAALAGAYYREYANPDRPSTFQPGDNKRKWLARNGASAGHAADPENVPYYLLIVGPPTVIPYSFQYQLDVEYGVGRIWFGTAEQPDLDAFARYAESVVEAEKDPPPLARRVAFFGVQNDDDPSTRLSAPHLVRPLADKLARGTLGQSWAFDAEIGTGATKSRLADFLGGKDTPAILFTASHGMAFPTGDKRQLPHQGALLCQDWPGPRAWGRREIPADYYFAADAVGDRDQLLGLIAFHFACYGAGTPDTDDFPHSLNRPIQSYTTPEPIVAQLPQRLLGHPRGGALAVIGHVERAWGCSFYGGPGLGEQLATFQSVLTQLLKGVPVGWATEYMNQYHAALGTELGEKLQRMNRGWKPDGLDLDLARLWTANADARNFVVFGDPAVRAMVNGTDAGPRREIRPITFASIPKEANSPPPAPSADGSGGDPGGTGQGVSFQPPAGFHDASEYTFVREGGPGLTITPAAKLKEPEDLLIAAEDYTNRVSELVGVRGNVSRLQKRPDGVSYVTVTLTFADGTESQSEVVERTAFVRLPSGQAVRLSLTSRADAPTASAEFRRLVESVGPPSDHPVAFSLAEGGARGGRRVGPVRVAMAGDYQETTPAIVLKDESGAREIVIRPAWHNQLAFGPADVGGVTHDVDETGEPFAYEMAPRPAAATGSVSFALGEAADTVVEKTVGGQRYEIVVRSSDPAAPAGEIAEVVAASLRAADAPRPPAGS